MLVCARVSECGHGRALPRLLVLLLLLLLCVCAPPACCGCGSRLLRRGCRYIAYPTVATRRYVPQWITVMRGYDRAFRLLPEAYEESDDSSEGSVLGDVDDEDE